MHPKLRVSKNVPHAAGVVTEYKLQCATSAFPLLLALDGSLFFYGSLLMFLRTVIVVM